MTTIANLLPNGDTKRIGNWIAKEAVALSTLRRANLIVTNDDLNARAGAPGNVSSIPFYNPLSGGSTVGSDDLSSHITPGNITGGEFLAVRQTRNKAWSGASLAAMVTGLDPMTAIASKVAEWLALDEQDQIMAYLNGVRANALANDAASMSAGSATAYLDGVMLADASQTKGERKGLLNTLIIHSAVHNKLVKDNMVASIPGSQQDVGFGVYQGKTLVVSDALPSASANSITSYTSILCAPGVFAIGETAPERGSVSVVASETAGGGSGGDTLIHRRVQIMGVQGYSYVGDATVGGPDNTALAVGTNHARKYDTKQVPLVFINSRV